MTNPVKPDQVESKTGAGFAGAGGGTLVAVIASGLEESNPLKHSLLYAAPSLSILLSAAWIWAQVAIANYFRDKEVQLLVGSAKSALESALKNPNTSIEHKEKIRKELEQLELVTVESLMSRVNSLKINTSSDVPSA
jgi:hypothetical protein